MQISQNSSSLTSRTKLAAVQSRHQFSITSDYVTIARLTKFLHLISWDNILDRLIRKLQVFLKRHSVFDLPQHHRCSDDQADRQQYPVRDEQTHVLHLETVESPHNGCAGGLDSSGFAVSDNTQLIREQCLLVETSEVCKLAAIVCHSSHEPIIDQHLMIM